MRIFIIGTGRAGSVSFIKACKHISNYTCAHEQNVKKLGEERFIFPDNHIEADCRLAWFLGQVNEKFGKDAFYVHLTRNRDSIAKSYAKRYHLPVSIVRAFAEGIKMIPLPYLHHKNRLQNSYDYVDTVNANINMFLANKPMSMEVHLENIKEEFKLFWHKINAEGDLNKALEVFDVKHNASPSRRKLKLHIWLKLSIYKVIRMFD